MKLIAKQWSVARFLWNRHTMIHADKDHPPLAAIHAYCDYPTEGHAVCHVPTSGPLLNASLLASWLPHGSIRSIILWATTIYAENTGDHHWHLVYATMKTTTNVTA